MLLYLHIIDHFWELFIWFSIIIRKLILTTKYLLHFHIFVLSTVSDSEAWLYSSIQQQGFGMSIPGYSLILSSWPVLAFSNWYMKLKLWNSHQIRVYNQDVPIKICINLRLRFSIIWDLLRWFEKGDIRPSNFFSCLGKYMEGAQVVIKITLIGQLTLV